VNPVEFSKARVRDGIVPSVCSRHGLPGVHARQVTIMSRPAAWSYALAVVGLLGIVAALMVAWFKPSSGAAYAVFGLLMLVLAPLFSRFKVPSPRWPFCQRCQTERNRGQLIALGLVTAGVIAFAVLVWLNPSNAFLAYTLLLAVPAVIIAGALVSLSVRWRVLTRAIASRTEAVVLIRRPHPQFADAATALIHQARQ
jgi:uncharacterized membrane protein HdeD (DUF308 family)